MTWRNQTADDAIKELVALSSALEWPGNMFDIKDGHEGLVSETSQISLGYRQWYWRKIEIRSQELVDQSLA